MLSVHALRLKYPYANRPYSSGYFPGSLESGAVSAQVLYNRILTIQLSIAGRYYTATAVIGICRNCISIYIKHCYFLTRDFNTRLYRHVATAIG